MAASNPKTHLKCESKLSTFEAIKCDISPENLPSLGKESLKQYCKELRLKVTGEKQELVERLAPLGKSAELFQKKVLRISQTYKFSTSLEASEVPPPLANWKIIGRNEDPNVPVVNENTIRDYQKAKYAGKKGQYRKAHLMFSLKMRITSVKMMESNSKRSFVKANILKSYTNPALRVGTITAIKVPSLLGFNGVKEFDNGWFAIKNRIDEHVLNPRRSKLPNFIRGKQQEQNAIQQFQNDSKMSVSQCGYFKHPSDSRFGASPDGVSTGWQQFLVEIKTRPLPNNTQLEKLNEEEKNKKMEIALKPLPHVRRWIITLLNISPTYQ